MANVLQLMPSKWQPWPSQKQQLLSLQLLLADLLLVDRALNQKKQNKLSESFAIVNLPNGAFH